MVFAGKDDNTTRTVILIVVPTAIFVMALIVTCIILRKRKQRKPRQRTEGMFKKVYLDALLQLKVLVYFQCDKHSVLWRYFHLTCIDITVKLVQVGKIRLNLAL